MTGRPTVQPGEIIADRYELCERIGSGCMSHVYRALDQSDNDANVAVKILDTAQPTKSGGKSSNAKPPR